MPITRVQSKTANSGASSVNNLDVTLDAAPTAGNLLVLAASFVGTSSAVFVDGAPTGTGITWTVVPPAAAGASNTSLLVAMGRVFSEASATINVRGASSGGLAVAVAEYAPAVAGGLFVPDRRASATATSTSAASGATATTAAAKELWVGAISHRVSGGTTFTDPTNSFTIVAQDKSALSTTSDRSVCLMEQIVSATGTPNAGATVTSGIWVAMALAIQEVSSSGGVPLGLLRKAMEGGD